MSKKFKWWEDDWPAFGDTWQELGVEDEVRIAEYNKELAALSEYDRSGVPRTIILDGASCDWNPSGRLQWLCNSDSRSKYEVTVSLTSSSSDGSSHCHPKKKFFIATGKILLGCTKVKDFPDKTYRFAVVSDRPFE